MTNPTSIRDDLRTRALLLVCALALAPACGRSGDDDGRALVLRDAGARGPSNSGGKDGSVPDGGYTSGGSGSADPGAAQDAGQAPERPERPSWKPPFELGEPGWRMSAEPLCSDVYGEYGGHDVFSTQDGVYALVSRVCNPFAGGCDVREQGLELHFNDGSGWQRQHVAIPTTNIGISGLPDGTAIIHGDDPCGITFVRDGEASCEAELGGLVTEVFAVRSDLAYASQFEVMYRFDGVSFNELARLPFTVEGIWADDDHVVVVGFDQSIYMKTGSGEFEPLPDVPAGDYTTVWGFGSNELYAGNRVGQLVRFDGSAWTTIETGSTGGVLSMWGKDGTLYFHTRSKLGVYDGGATRWLIDSSDRVTFGGLWGNAVDEVFVALEDSEYEDYDCGGSSFILRFDGKAFHQM